jgi:hypothetical protein
MWGGGSPDKDAVATADASVAASGLIFSEPKAVLN